ncbi:MAG TPA: diguanylate cyclase [Mycobacteriales bacterium]|nr:diguanylate cyclase [Mycobacteriales bacterium]
MGDRHAALRTWLDRREAAYEGCRTGVGFEVARSALALFSLAAVSAQDGVPAGALAAHLGVLAASAAVLLALPAVARAGRERQLGAAVTAATLLFFVGYCAAFADVPGAGTSMGVLALVEAPLRYGRRGAPLSAVPVTWAALAWPQTDAAGRTLHPGVTVTLVVLLVAAVLVLREVQRRSAVALAGAAQGFAEAMLHLPLGVAVVDGDGRVVHGNPALAGLVGPVPPGTPLADRLRGDATAVARVLAGEAPSERLLCRLPDGREAQLGATRVHVPGPLRTVVHLQDVTDQQRERAALLHVSRHDALTGLLTRQAGEEVLASALRRSPAVAVLFLDLDGFKALNDGRGHAVGDLVLQQVAARIAGALRPTETAVRWGGDEFVVLCSGVAGAEVGAVAERLLEVLRRPFQVTGLPLLHLTASVGAAVARPGAPAAAVLAAADAAMYGAKRAGGDRWAPSLAVPHPAVPVP